LKDPAKRINVTARRVAEGLILEYLANPENPFLYSRNAVGGIASISDTTVCRWWPGEKFDDLLNRAAEKRKGNLSQVRRGYTKHLLKIDKKVLEKAESGSLGHAHLAYDRFEGPAATKLEVTGKDGDPLFSPEKLLAEILKKGDE